MTALVAGGLLVLNVCASGLWNAKWFDDLYAWLPAELMILVGFVLATFSVSTREPQPGRAFRMMLATWAAVGLVYGALGFIPKLYFSTGTAMTGRYLVFFLVAVTKSSDVGAYVVGTLTAARPGGNHKLSPRLSPKKSWEGLAGGVAASVLCALILLTLAGGQMSFRGLPLLGYGAAVVLAIVFALLGLAGDLFESLLKRAAGADDSGHLPGLGGALDVVDSLIFNAPVFYAYVLYRVLPYV